MTDPTRIGHVFIVGCPRSGTTLVQTMLGSHPQILTLPETHFFHRAPARGWRRRLGLASSEAAAVLDDVLEHLGNGGSDVALAPRGRRLSTFAQQFIQVLDSAARREGKTVWVEKTPRHLARIPLIQRLVLAPRFLHVVREGRDVVASMFQVGEEHSEIWGRRSIVQCADRWNRDLAATRSWMNEPNHKVVLYDQLLDEPQVVLQELCTFLGLTFDATMLEYWKHSKWAARWSEQYPWIEGAFQPLRETRGRKFDSLLGPEAQEQALARLTACGDPRRALGVEIAP